MVMKYVDWALRRRRDEPEILVCPTHNVVMRLRGVQGRPTRFNRQTEEEYTYIYYCPVQQCNETAERLVASSQAPFPDEYPERPIYARAKKTPALN